MFEKVKVLAAAAALALVAPLSASAVTVIETDCGIIADEGAVNCGSVNLAVHGTAFAFEANAADGADGGNGFSGKLTINTYVDPYYSTATANANILLTILGVGAGSVSFGGGQIPLVLAPNGGTLSAVISAVFPGSGEANGIPFILEYEGLAGGDLISVNLSAVPVPAAGFLLLGALGGLGLARRRKKAS